MTDPMTVRMSHMLLSVARRLKVALGRGARPSRSKPCLSPWGVGARPLPEAITNAYVVWALQRVGEKDLGPEIAAELHRLPFTPGLLPEI